MTHADLATITAGMSTARWVAEVPVRRVSMIDLVPIQTRPDHLHAAWAGGADPYPHAVDVGGVLYLEDGHHRYWRAAALGARDLDVRVFTRSGDGGTAGTADH